MIYPISLWSSESKSKEKETFFKKKSGPYINHDVFDTENVGSYIIFCKVFYLRCVSSI